MVVSWRTVRCRTAAPYAEAQFRIISQFALDISTMGSGFIKGTLENGMVSFGFGNLLPACMMKRGPLCRLLDRFFHGKFKGSSILHHGHIHLFDMNSGMAILYVQCHTTFKLNGCKLLHNLLQPPFKRCNWGHGPGGNMTLRSIIALVMPVLIWISLVFLSTSSLRWRTRESATCQHAWLIFHLNYFQRTFPDSLPIWQENASYMQKHAVPLYPSLPNAILFHLKRDNHLDVLSRSVYQFIVGAQHTFKGWLSFNFISLYVI